MNKDIIKRAAAALTALVMCTAVLAGCSKEKKPEETSATLPQSGELNIAGDEESKEGVMTTRALNEGDVYAINKFKVDPLPANYQLAAKSLENQGMVFVNGVSKITVMAINYKEDLQDLATYADSACAALKLNNMLYQSDTEFTEPQNTKIAGFDAVTYDFTITRNEVEERVNEKGNKEVVSKTPIEWYKSRIYFFYSDKDAYYALFECQKDDWDSTIGGFEEFMANVTIDENAVNDPTEETAQQ